MRVELFPALDLRGGRVVRLVRGEDTRRTAYAADPRAVLAAFAAAGARWAHVVDLDAAFGEPPQRALLARLLTLPGRPALQVGGGLRSREAVVAALELGCERVVVGSLAARAPRLFGELSAAYPGRVVPALDVAGETVRVDGWRAPASPWRQLAATLRGVSCPAVLVTDIGRDGTLAGPNLELACAVARASGLPALVSGGVATLDHLAEAGERPEVAGVVFGKALYEGAFTFGEALGHLRRLAPAPASGSREASGRPAISPAPPSGEPPGDGAGEPLTELAARVIPCLDVAGGRVVKGVRFTRLVDEGDPAEAARRYAAEGADELVLLDVSASREARGTRLDWVERVAREVFVPLTVGGGVVGVADARRLLLAGADKVAVNSAPVARPELLGELAGLYGSQCVVLSVDARRRPSGGWEVVTHGGGRPSGRDALDWLAEGVERGAGEVLLTSIDGDGTRGGYDLELVAAAARRVTVPVIASGGAGSVEHLAAALAAGASAVLAASIFHRAELTVGEVKRRLAELGFRVRLDEEPAA